MAIVDMVMPKMGESIMEATILKWHKKPGDFVKADETLLDIATDKVDSEIPATVSGTVSEILYNENDVVPIGNVIVKITTDAPVAATTTVAPSQTPVVVEEKEDEVIDVPYVPTPVLKSVNQNHNGNGSAKNNGFFSPLVMNIAGSEGVTMQELQNIEGSGNEGRVTKKDILHFVEQKKNSGTDAYNTTDTATKEATDPQVAYKHIVAAPETPAAPKPTSGNVEIIEMDRMRKLISKHMVNSVQTSAHVTSFAEADVTHMVLWRDKVKKAFEAANGTKITFTPMFIDCLVRVMKRFPMINSSVDGDRILLKKDINIGMATALPNGNLIVPVIHNADILNLTGLSKKVNSLADAGRNNRLKPEDTQNGTFTLTNVGTFGSLMGTPIINQPQVAILAVGAIKKKPVVIETQEGDTIGIRHMMYLSLSYDHRIIDGSLGASFLTAVAKEFEAWDVNREY